MNVGDIKTRVKRTFGDESGVQITDGDIVRWINDAQRDIVNQNEGILEAITTANTVVDGMDYALPADLLVLRSVSYKSSTDRSYFPLVGMTLQQFDMYIDGWDGTQFNSSKPTTYCVYNKTLKVFPKPNEVVTGGIKIYYQRQPTEVSIDGDIPELPLQYHNAIVTYCLSQSFALDEDWDSAGNVAQQMTADVTANREREKWINQEFYPTITVLPEDTDCY